MVALRKAVPYVGSSIILTSIVIWIILLALSAWYFMWWALTRSLSEQKLLKRLQVYLTISAVYYLAIVYPSFAWVLENALQQIGFVPTLFLFSLIFFAIPTFLASHAMPIITHISQGTKWFAAWKILFISTIWSFLGSTVTTLLLFPYLGVYWTGILSSAILLLCGLLVYVVSHSQKMINTTIAHSVLLAMFLSAAILWRPTYAWYYEDTPYQTIEIIEWEINASPAIHWRIMKLNGGFASGIDTETKTSFFHYVRAIVDAVKQQRPTKIAVIWAAWCTLPQELAKLWFIQQIDVIDIDKEVFSIAENYFLKEKLHTKIVPITQSARGRLYDKKKLQEKYDMVIIDVYNGVSLPEEVVTREFFADVHQIANTVVMNVIIDKSLTSPFAQWFLHTLLQVFHDVYAKEASGTPIDYPIWNKIFATFPLVNGYALEKTTTDVIYTDDKSEADTLRVQMMY